MIVLAAGGVAVAVWLLIPPPRAAWRVLRRGRRSPIDAVARARGSVLTALAAVSTGALVVLVDGTTLALGLILLGAVAAAWRIRSRIRRRHAADECADAVVEVCEALAGELRAGQPPLVSMRRAAEAWPPMETVAAAGELGADVPRALRRLAGRPGASGLAQVAAAWQVSEGSGGAMAGALDRVAKASRARRATDRLVASELASARATARLVAGLPLVVLLMGSGLGGDPWGFLTSTPLGLACLSLGLLLAYAGLEWIEKIAAVGS